MNRVIWAGLVAVAAATPVAAQTALKTNEPVSGKIAKERETNEWTVELKEDKGTIRFSVLCETGRLRASLYRDGKTPITLHPVNNKGGRTAAHSVHGDKEFECQPEKPLVAGRYTIRISGDRPTDIGPYTIQLSAPTFADKVEPVKPPVVAPAPGEVESLKKRVEELETRVKLLEKYILDKK